MSGHHQAKTNEDQVGHQKFINYPYMHRILRFCLKISNETERTFKYKQPKKAFAYAFWFYCLLYFFRNSVTK